MAYEFRISGEIGGWWDGYTTDELQVHLDAANGDDLFIDINSEGGQVDIGMSIYAKLKRYAKENEAKITTRTDGLIASIATIIFLAGSRRIVNEYMQPFIHVPAVLPNAETADDHEQGADMLNKVQNIIAGFYADNTEMDKEKALELMKGNTWLTANECLTYGFATEIETLSDVNFKLVASLKKKINVKNKSMKTEKNYGEKAVELARNILGIKAENKLVLDADQNELDFYNLEDDASIAVGDMANVDGEPATGEHVITSPDDADETWTLTFEAGELTEIDKADDEGADDAVEALKAEIAELKEAQNTLKTEAEERKNKVDKYEATLNKIASIEPKAPDNKRERNESGSTVKPKENRASAALDEIQLKK